MIGKCWPPCLSGQWERGDVLGETSRGCYVGVAVVGCWVGLHWSVGDVWRSWSHMCGSWYFPSFLLRGVLNADEHGFLDGPGCSPPCVQC